MSSEKVAVVTGSNKGLGYAIVKGLCANEKFNGIVYLTARDEKRGRNAVQELNALGLKPVYHQLDITDPASVTKFCEYIRKKHGQMDILVNNAAVFFSKDAKEPKDYQAEQALQVNFFATVDFSEAILPLISKDGRIINISSSSGHLARIPSEDLRKKIGSEDLGLDELKALMKSYVDAVRENKEIEAGWGESAYVVSKVGFTAYCFHLYRRLTDKGQLVIIVHPGYVKTDMTQGLGNVTPEQAADMVLKFGLSSTAPHGSRTYVWHNGTVVPWDGPDPRGYIDGKAV